MPSLLIPARLHGPSWSKCLKRQQIRSPDVSAPGSSGVLRGISLRLGTAGDGARLLFPLIGVGGILSAADARTTLHAGANLLQIYTGFAYRGADLLEEIVRGLRSQPAPA